MKLMTSLLLLGLCGLFGTLSTTEAAAVPLGTTKANHGAAIASENSRTVTEINITKRNDNAMAAIKVTDVAVTPSPDSEPTTTSNITHTETNNTKFEWTNTTTDTNTTIDTNTTMDTTTTIDTNSTIDTNTTTDPSNNTNAAVSSRDSSTAHGSAGVVEAEAGRTDIAQTTSTDFPAFAQSTARAVHKPLATDGVLVHGHSSSHTM